MYVYGKKTRLRKSVEAFVYSVTLDRNQVIS